MMNVEEIRKDFPVLNQKIYDRDLIYLDNGATTQQPKCVMDAVVEHYLHDNANVHRGIHALSEKSTESFEHARKTIMEFLGAESREEIIFTSGATDSLNMIARGIEDEIREGDHILVSELEHHSNFVPWQQLAKRKGAFFDVVPCPEGIFDMQAFQKLLANKPKIVSVAHGSNLLGSILPVAEIVQMAHAQGALVSIDGAQQIRHSIVNVKELDCDFYSFSGHKVMGPTGIGVLYGKKEALLKLNPVRFGGGMVDVVTKENTSFGPLPERLEAGTPNYVGAIGLARALQYITEIGREEIAAYESELIAYAVKKLKEIPEILVYGKNEEHCGVVSFNIKGVHSYDAASFLDKLGVAFRSGNHCAQPAMAMIGESAVLRLSVAFYNTKKEVDAAVDAILRVVKIFSKYQ